MKANLFNAINSSSCVVGLFFRYNHSVNLSILEKLEDMVSFICGILMMMFLCEKEASILLSAGGRGVTAECVRFQFLDIEPSCKIARVQKGKREILSVQSDFLINPQLDFFIL